MDVHQNCRTLDFKEVFKNRMNLIFFVPDQGHLLHPATALAFPQKLSFIARTDSGIFDSSDLSFSGCITLKKKMIETD
jgi:hypothetical protein